jgi:hypothetical protein
MTYIYVYKAHISYSVSYFYISADHVQVYILITLSNSYNKEFDTVCQEYIPINSSETDAKNSFSAS